MNARACARYRPAGKGGAGGGFGDEPLNPGALDLGEGATTAAHANGAVGNSVCRHAACALHTFCIVAELEKLRDNYEKFKHQFQIKARLVPLNRGGVPLLTACTAV